MATRLLARGTVSTLISRKNHVWTQDNVVRSPCKDIVIPDTTVNEYIWRNLDKWATKTATVMSKMFVLYHVLLLMFLQFMVRALF